MQAAFASAERKEQTRGARANKEAAIFLRDIFTTVVKRELFPSSTILVSVQVLGNQGGALACAINAVSLALMHAAVPMKDLVFAATGAPHPTSSDHRYCSLVLAFTRAESGTVTKQSSVHPHSSLPSHPPFPLPAPHPQAQSSTRFRFSISTRSSAASPARWYASAGLPAQQCLRQGLSNPSRALLTRPAPLSSPLLAGDRGSHLDGRRDRLNPVRVPHFCRKPQQRARAGGVREQSHRERLQRSLTTPHCQHTCHELAPYTDLRLASRGVRLVVQVQMEMSDTPPVKAPHFQPPPLRHTP